jgi:hypothetical protein
MSARTVPRERSARRCEEGTRNEFYMYPRKGINFEANGNKQEGGEDQRKVQDQGKVAEVLWPFVREEEVGEGSSRKDGKCKRARGAQSSRLIRLAAPASSPSSDMPLERS